MLEMDTDEPSLSSTLLADRQLVVSYLASLIPHDSRGDSLSDTSLDQAICALAEAMHTVVSDPDFDWRDIVAQACFNKPTRDWLEARAWLLDTTQGDIAALVRGVPLDRIVDDEMERFLMDERQEKGGCSKEVLGWAGILRKDKK